MRAVLNKHNNQEYTPMHTRKTKKSFILKTTLIISLLFSSNYMLGQKASTNFQDFYKRFETDCDYQQSHVALPITSVVLDDIDINDNEIYDTLTIDEWKCEKNFYSFEKTFECVSKNVWRVVYGIPETGFRVEYYFVLKKNEWYLDRIVDLSL